MVVLILKIVIFFMLSFKNIKKWSDTILGLGCIIMSFAIIIFVIISTSDNHPSNMPTSTTIFIKTINK